MRVLKPDTEIEKLHTENTYFLSSKFYDKKMYFSFMWGGVGIRDGVYVLKKSIEIIKSKLYSPPIFRERVLFNSTDSAPEFWKDLYWLNCYEDRKDAIEYLIPDYQRRFENNPYKDDILTKKDHDEVVNGLQEELNELNEIIELSKEFRTSINEVFPDLETEFAQRLQGYEKEIERKWELKELRDQRIANKTATTSQDNPKELYKRTLDKVTESKILENYKFWNDIGKSRGNTNIFKGITQQVFLSMVSTADFSEIKIHGISQRVEYNTIVILGHILNDNEWIRHAEKNLKTTFDNAQKHHDFGEYEELKNKFLQ